MSQNTSKERKLNQVLDWGEIRQERLSPADTMFTTSGHRLYVLGDIDGRFRPRSNPYDLYAYGRPHPKDPLAEKLQGVWAQPVKGLSSYSYQLEIEGERWDLQDADTFTQTFSNVQFSFHRGSLQANRSDFVAQDLPLLLSTLTLSNDGPGILNIHLSFVVEFDLQDAWFTHLAERRNNGQQVTIDEDNLIAVAEALPDQWAVAVGSKRPGGITRLLDGGKGAFVYHIHLAPGQVEKLTFGIAIESQGGSAAAKQVLARGISSSELLLQEKKVLYERLLASGTRLSCPDTAINTAFDLSKANLQLLEAVSPALGSYFYAGLEMFPFWFSNDGAYSLPGLMVGGFHETALNHLRIGFDHLQDGRVPHQISPSGRIAFAGNAQETPLWVSSLWHAYRWTGDRDFLTSVYPGAVKGLFDYVLGTIDPDRDGYPSGPGMVEVEGMGEEKLDSAAYTWEALIALADMAAELGDDDTAAQARERAEEIFMKFERDWWDAGENTYAMSLDQDNNPYPVPHWAVIVPLEVRLASPERAADTFAILRRKYLTRWGLKHTVGDDDRVWTLPTATLSRAAYNYNEPQIGFEMLRHVAETLEAGSIGLFHELIPEGACIIQLWSAATFLRGIVEDLLGIQVNSARHLLHITPQLPKGWDVVRLEDLSFGEHRISLSFEPGRLIIHHLSGFAPLTITWRLPNGHQRTALVPPGGIVELSDAY